MNWKFLKNPEILGGIIIVIWICALIGGLIHYHNLDENLKDRGKFRKIEKKIESEIEKPSSPPDTITPKPENWSKKEVAIRFEREYRTKLNPDEFRAFYRKELAENGWFYIGIYQDGFYLYTDVYCKGNLNANLSQKKQTIWESAVYDFVLEIEYRNRSSETARQNLPGACIE